MLKSKIVKFLLKIRGGCPKTAEELRHLGAHIGENFSNYARIDVGHAYLLTVGNNVTLSDCRILLHDASTKTALGYSRIGRVEIGDNTFVGADAIILPNVKIGSNCIIGAGSIVNRDIPNGSVAVGNPARVIGTYDEFVNRNKANMEKCHVYETYWKNKSVEEKQKEYNDLKDGGIAYDQ